MKLICRNTKWHRWFAWHPVQVKQSDCRWLEFVERRFVESLSDYWIYRSL